MRNLLLVLSLLLSLSVPCFATGQAPAVEVQTWCLIGYPVFVTAGMPAQQVSGVIVVAWQDDKNRTIQCLIELENGQFTWRAVTDILVDRKKRAEQLKNGMGPFGPVVPAQGTTVKPQAQVPRAIPRQFVK